MRYTLMHKRIAAAELELDEDTGIIKKIYSVYAPEHLPVGVAVKKAAADRAALNEWWINRSIPASRSGVRDALETLGVTSTGLLLTRCFGLSLSDQYWIRPEHMELTWDQINFFNHAFSDDVGDVLFGNPQKIEEFDFCSPDNTSDGCLKKRWKIMDGRRCLVKGGSNPFHQQPFNEVIACKIMERLDIPHVPYTLLWSNGEPYSICEDFVTADTELVSAWRIMQTQKKANDTSVYQHFADCCQALGAPSVVPALDRMIVLDYLIANEDRHLNNFGLLRDAESLEWIGFAPIYDSGSSLGYDKVPAQIRAEQNIVCKPFKKHHAEQLKLVSSFAWIDFEQLADVEFLIRETLSTEQARDFIDESRVAAVAESVRKRITELEKIAQAHQPDQRILSTADDVEKDIAQSY